MNTAMIIETAEAQCAGCLRCMLACSFFTSGKQAFNPALSKIQVEPGSGDGKLKIVFLEGCNNCGICTRYCEFGALNIHGGKTDE